MQARFNACRILSSFSLGDMATLLEEMYGMDSKDFRTGDGETGDIDKDAAAAFFCSCCCGLVVVVVKLVLAWFVFFGAELTGAAFEVRAECP